MNLTNKLIPVLLFFGTAANAQHYTATHGSGYFGSLNVYNNPSSIVNSPYKWDLTLFGIQYQAITNAIQGKNFPFYLLPGPAFSGAQGNFPRKGNVNYNIRLLNGRYSLDQNHAFAFGLNFRGYSQARTSTIDFSDSVKGPRTFLTLNEKNHEVSVRMSSTAWMELYGTYGWTIFDREVSRLNAGATVRIMRGMAAGFANANGIRVEKAVAGDQTVYTVGNGAAKYGYSDNLGDASSIRASDLFRGSHTSVALDLGVEYTVKTEAVTSIYDEGGDPDYEWKIGFSILDIGSNRYRYGAGSRTASSVVDSVTGAMLQSKFLKIKKLSAFNDSLATIVNQIDPLTGNFNVANPTRVVVNVDRYLSGNFFLNGELSVNLSGDGKSKPAVQETSLITVTPRWETRNLGLYIPFQVTQLGGFWMGAAVKAGPLLLGTHNLLNAFSKHKNVSGGGYLAVILRPTSFIRSKRLKQYDCPSY